MTDLRLGINLWSQATGWPALLEAAKAADDLGYDHVWTWDHLYAIFGDPHQPISRAKPSWRRSRGDTFWTGPPPEIAKRVVALRRLGFDTIIAELPAPHDAETMETFAQVVKPMVEDRS